MKTLLKNGTIVDGSGGKPYVSDVLIENDKITKIAKDIDAADAEVIDCTGLTVAPGFIDAHSHNDFFYDYDDAERFYEPFIRQGITTQITGNCGFSPFGVDKNTKYKDKVGGGLFHAKNPGSFKDFVKNAEGKLYVNIVPLIGHGTTRISISGFDAKPLTKEQIDEEMKLVDEAMENGAFGGSFGFMYEPGMYSKTDELVAFAKELQQYDGILTIHRARNRKSRWVILLSRNRISKSRWTKSSTLWKSRKSERNTAILFSSVVRRGRASSLCSKNCTTTTKKDIKSPTTTTLSLTARRSSQSLCPPGISQ